MHPIAVFRCSALATLLIALAPLAQAGGLYTGQAPVNSQTDADRADALKSALAQVVVKLTGNNAVLARPEVANAVANAGHYVQQYQYTQEVATDAGQPQLRLNLVAQFDRDAVDRLLSGLGLGHAGGDAAPAAVDLQPQSYRVWVSGVGSAEDYARAVGALSRNELVRSVQAEQAHGDGVELQLEVVGPLPRLLESFSSGPLRVLNAKPPVDGIDALLGMQP